MQITLQLGNKTFHTHLGVPIDLSIPIGPLGPTAWYVDPVKIEPVINERFIGSVALGGAVNFRNIWFNPHGHGTHTETIGHIEPVVQSINQTLKQFFFIAQVITVEPTLFGGVEEPHMKVGDLVISEAQLKSKLIQNLPIESLIVRSLPNTAKKKTANYSNSNPAYFEPKALSYIRSKGIMHLLTDLPSVDREEDGGKLLAHRAFWKEKNANNHLATITEMIYVPAEAPDGLYLLNLQIAPFENDATPSKPVIFKLEQN